MDRESLDIHQEHVHGPTRESLKERELDQDYLTSRVLDIISLRRKDLFLHTKCGLLEKITCNNIIC